MTFEISISHQGWRYPETVRMAVRRGATSRSSLASTYRRVHALKRSQIPPNSFHEKANDALPIGSARAATHAAIDLLAPQRRLRHLHALVLSYVRLSNP